MSALNLSYPEILDHFGKHKVPGRTASRAFLGWFLENYFRLEQLRVEDSICDGPDDRGIDGLYVDSTLEVIYAFQSKLMQNDSKTLGDSALREFAGSLGQLNSAEGVKALANATGNAELKNLIIDEGLADKVESGYENHRSIPPVLHRYESVEYRCDKGGSCHPSSRCLAVDALGLLFSQLHQQLDSLDSSATFDRLSGRPDGLTVLLDCCHDQVGMVHVADCG